MTSPIRFPRWAQRLRYGLAIVVSLSALTLLAVTFGPVAFGGIPLDPLMASVPAFAAASLRAALISIRRYRHDLVFLTQLIAALVPGAVAYLAIFGAPIEVIVILALLGLVLVGAVVAIEVSGRHSPVFVWQDAPWGTAKLIAPQAVHNGADTRDSKG